MASFIVLPNGDTKAIIRRKEFGLSDKGTPRARTKTGTDKAMREWARGIEAELDGTGASTYHELKDACMGGVLIAFRDEEVPKRKGARHDVHRINKFLREPWVHLDFTQDIATALNAWKRKCMLPKGKAHDPEAGYGLKPGSVRRDLNLIHSAVEWARKEKGLKLVANPVSGVKRPADGGRRTRIWGDEDLQIFLDVAGFDLNVKPETQTAKVGWVLSLARWTGWRLSEICGIQNQTYRQSHARRNSRHSGYINLDVPEVFFPGTEMDGEQKLGGTKNDAGFHAPLRAEAVQLIEALLRHFPTPTRQDYDAPTPTLLGIDAATAGELYRRVRIKVADEYPELANIVIHELRHTFTTEVAKAIKGDMPSLLAITGRKSAASLLHYTHMDPGHLSAMMNTAMPKLRRVK